MPALIAHDIPLKSFYFMRHGVTQWNEEGRQQGKTDIPLNKKGRDQVEKLRPLCEALPITLFYSSTLSRASETTQILNKTLKLPVYYEDDLQEQGKGALEGITQAEWQALERQVIAREMEDRQKFKKRTQEVLHKILSTQGVPCIVSHSNNARCIARLLGLALNDVPQDVILHFEYTPQGWKLNILRATVPAHSPVYAEMVQ